VGRRSPPVVGGFPAVGVAFSFFEADATPEDDEDHAQDRREENRLRFVERLFWPTCRRRTLSVAIS
jgi:hypothetical protein